MELLTRNVFRESVFARDGYKCVICGKPAKDAHHILERRLFSDGGYYLDNGASLCEKHHIQAEQTTLSCEDIRQAAGIDKVVLPDHFYFDSDYDKWGNILLSGNRRIRGELFFDESVQKILKQGGVMTEFVKYVKYPRTYHLPWSVGTKDDRFLPNTEGFKGKEVVVTLKMDGENTTMYNDYIHARSIDSGSHPSRDRVKGIWANIAYMLDDNMRICGENLYAVHSVKYENLSSYFMLFSFWIDNECLGWDETLQYGEILGLDTVPVIYEGIYDEVEIKSAFVLHGLKHEGYVVRLRSGFMYNDFRTSVAKYVSPLFRTKINNSHGHWISKKIEVNELR